MHKPTVLILLLVGHSRPVVKTGKSPNYPRLISLPSEPRLTGGLLLFVREDGRTRR